MPVDPNEPITIDDSDPGWAYEFKRVSAALREALGDVAIEHIGSTAVPGLAAKPILDMVILFDDVVEAGRLREGLETIGYSSEGDKDIPGREAYRRVSNLTPTSKKGSWMDHHLYLAARTSEFISVQRQFRDYLVAHPETAERYGTLKRSLAAAFGHNRADYTDAKGPFVRAVLSAAEVSAAANADAGSNPTIAPSQAGDAGTHQTIDVRTLSAIQMRVGTVISAMHLPNAKRPAIVMEIDFGRVGLLTTSAQITDHYQPARLLGRQVVAVVNLPPKQIGSVMSRCLVLGASDGQGIVVLGTERPVPNGALVY
jgi:export-related chaperone CsaA